MGNFERYLSVWVGLGIVAGVVLGHFFGPQFERISSLSVGTVNLPVAVLIWGMIFPMMVQIDFSVIRNFKQNLSGLGLTVIINWIIKPFSMAALAFVFFHYAFGNWLTNSEQQEYLAGSILLGAAPCTAMVFVWSFLTKGNANYTLVQVVVNDLILIFAFVPLVALLFSLFQIDLVSSTNEIGIPVKTLLFSVLLFVVLPLSAALLLRFSLMKKKGKDWFSATLPQKLKPLSVGSLILTLIFLFAFQGKVIIEKPLHILLIALPLTIQTYFVFFLTKKIGEKMNLSPEVVSPSSFIGASNFFELAVAVAISIYGLNSGASLATVVGVLIEVPIMLSLVKYINRKNHKKLKEEVAI